jgi:hypothetical protein
MEIMQYVTNGSSGGYAGDCFSFSPTKVFSGGGGYAPTACTFNLKMV